MGQGSVLRTYYMNRNRLLFIRRNSPGLARGWSGCLFFLLVAVPKNSLRHALQGEWDHLWALWRGLGWHLQGHDVHQNEFLPLLRPHRPPAPLRPLTLTQPGLSLSHYVFHWRTCFFPCLAAFCCSTCCTCWFLRGGAPAARPGRCRPMRAALRRMCVLMPAYRADAVIRETAPGRRGPPVRRAGRRVRGGRWPAPATVQALRQGGAGVIEVGFAKSTKGKALLAALSELPRGAYDVAVVLDVDNVMAPGFLAQRQRRLSPRATAWCRATAPPKTWTRPLPCSMPATRKSTTTFTGWGRPAGHVVGPHRLGHGFRIRLPAPSCWPDIGETVGEDKELDFRIARDRVKIAYLRRSLRVRRENRQRQVFDQQRTRWLATQLGVSEAVCGEGLRQLRRGNWAFSIKCCRRCCCPGCCCWGCWARCWCCRCCGRWGPGRVLAGAAAGHGRGAAAGAARAPLHPAGGPGRIAPAAGAGRHGAGPAAAKESQKLVYAHSARPDGAGFRSPVHPSPPPRPYLLYALGNHLFTRPYQPGYRGAPGPAGVGPEVATYPL